jgi:uncharacterized small protein (DUF1192 family)
MPGVSLRGTRAVKGPMMSERRGLRRAKSFLQGFVYVSRRRGALSCLIRDLSDKGARIIFSDTVTLPDVVDLFIPQRDQTIRARVQWRQNDEIGLAFEAADQTPVVLATATEVMQRVAMLEAEITALRTMLKRMKNDKNRHDEEAA